MMATGLPRDLVGLVIVVFLIGMKHGLDADHLAAIDGLARFNATERPRLARAVGALFAAGHGIVVASVAVGMSMLARVWQAPEWLEAFGAWVSITLLTLLALINIVGLLQTPAEDVVRLRGWRSGIFASLLQTRSPALVVGVGALFALSFDTVSQATLFAAVATQFGGWRPALVLAAAFIAGMLLIDGVNGAWVAHLIRRSDRSARAASRVMTITVSGVGLSTAALTLATRTLPDVDAWTRGKESWFGAAVIAVIGIAFVSSRRLAIAKSS